MPKSAKSKRLADKKDMLPIVREYVPLENSTTRITLRLIKKTQESLKWHLKKFMPAIQKNLK